MPFNESLIMLLLFTILVVVVLLKTATIVPQRSEFIVERLGKYRKTLGAGFHILIPFLDKVSYKRSLKEEVMDIPSQTCITKDNVTVQVDGVIYIQVVDSKQSAYGIEHYKSAAIQLAQTSLRSVLGQVELDDLLGQRDKINNNLQEILDRQTDPWGVKISNVEIKHVDLPDTMQRAMARQAESERERRAKVIHAMGEFEASVNLSKAAGQIATEPGALQLRFLQTMSEISAEKNSTILFPMPIDLLKPFLQDRKDPVEEPLQAAEKQTLEPMDKHPQPSSDL